MIVRQPVGPIQLQPPGLLGLLQLKIGGFAPDALVQTVQPTVELEPYWLRAAIQSETVGYSVALAATVYALVVPFTDTGTGLLTLGPTDREWWHVENYSASIQTGAGAAVSNVQLGYVANTGPGTPDGNFFLGSHVRALGASEFVPMVAEDFWLPPGARLGMWMDAVTSGANMVLRGLRYTRMPV